MRHWKAVEVDETRKKFKCKDHRGFLADNYAYILCIIEV